MLEIFDLDQNWLNQVCLMFNICKKKHFLAPYVVGMSIETLFDMWRNDEILNHFITKMKPHFWQLAINPKLKIQLFPWFLWKTLSNYVPPTWKLQNPYYHRLITVVKKGSSRSLDGNHPTCKHHQIKVKLCVNQLSDPQLSNYHQFNLGVDIYG